MRSELIAIRDPPRAHGPTISSNWYRSFSPLAGAVELDLRRPSVHNHAGDEEGKPDLFRPTTEENEIRQLTGCTSPETTITFSLTDDSALGSDAPWSDVYVLDAEGSVLARAEIRRSHR